MRRASAFMASSNSTGLPLPPVPYTKPFSQIVADFAAAAQAASKNPLDFSDGSVFLALAEATAGNADWLQKLYLFSLIVQRLQTSKGEWVDTFVADFMPAVDGTNSPRLPATPASGVVQFSSFAPQNQRVVPVGSLVSTFDGSQVYQVYADPTNNAYSADIVPGGGFIIPAGQTSLSVNVQALNPGTGGNVLANTITRIQSSAVGVDTVTNPAPITTGFDEESDDALKARFKLYIASLAAGTVGALEYAILSLQQGLQCVVHENVDPNGATDYGAFTIFVDDGSGAPPTQTVLNALAAVNGLRGRAAGVRPQVVSASKLGAAISLTVTVASGYNTSAVVAAVANAIGAYVNSLGLENPLHYSQLAAIAYGASPGVSNVTSLLLNSGTADLVPAMGQTIKVTSSTVNLGG